MIDWDFIAAREGGRILQGYVPNAPGDKSGVTIATGIDLGYYRLTDCVALPADLCNRIERYVGFTGFAARALLAATPLTVTAAEADLIEQPKRTEMLTALSTQYQRDAAVPFSSIPDGAQTVLMSVTWQYGAPWVRTPNFWRACCARDWGRVYADLENFGDAYSSRRKIEAAYLKQHVPF